MGDLTDLSGRQPDLERPAHRTVFRGQRISVGERALTLEAAGYLRAPRRHGPESWRPQDR